MKNVGGEAWPGNTQTPPPNNYENRYTTNKRAMAIRRLRTDRRRSCVRRNSIYLNKNPFMKHKHTKCKHELKLCEECDVVYCEKCEMEWSKNPSLTWTNGSTWNLPYTTGDDLTSYTISSHTHNV